VIQQLAASSPQLLKMMMDGWMEWTALAITLLLPRHFIWKHQQQQSHKRDEQEEKELTS
jgi:hypothetical protein